MGGFNSASELAPGVPGPGVPTGGNDGEVLRKVDDADYSTAWSPDSIPDGGGQGQVLAKRGFENRNTEWIDHDPFLDAPADTRLYGRQEARWQPIPPGLPDGGNDGDVLYREAGAGIWGPLPPTLQPLEFHLGPLAFVADGTEIPNTTKVFTAPTSGLPAGFYCTPVAIWAMRRTSDGTPTPSGSWSCELSWPDTGGGPGTFNPIGSTQNFGQVFNANRVLLYSLAGAAQPCMDPAVGTFSWRFRYTAGSLLSGPFTIRTGFLGRLYPFA